MSIEILENTCISCGRCAAVCPLRLFIWSKGEKARCPSAKPCIRCGHCVAACPRGAVLLDNKNPEKLSPNINIEMNEEQQIALFQGRRSIRTYTDERVPHSVLCEALEHANYAPTASNQQFVTWLLIEDAQKVQLIIHETIEWLRESKDKRFLPIIDFYEQGGEPILRGASQVIFACTPKTWIWGVHDASAALSYLELALHARHVGTCWTGFVISAVQHNAIPSLELPEDLTIHAGLMLGYPSFTYPRIPERKKVQLRII